MELIENDLAKLSLRSETMQNSNGVFYLFIDKQDLVNIEVMWRRDLWLGIILKYERNSDFANVFTVTRTVSHFFIKLCAGTYNVCSR